MAVPGDVLTNEALIRDLEAEAKDAAILHGIVTKIKQTADSSTVVSYAPFTLFPSPVLKVFFDQAVAMQTLFNRLVDKISQDPELLHSALSRNMKRSSERMVSRIVQAFRTQPIVVGLIRCDYMLDQGMDGNTAVKQTKIKTTAADFAGLASRMPAFHRHILNVAGRSEEREKILDNNPAAGLAEALAKAWELYGRERAVVMFLEAATEMNIYDHRYLENELWKRGIAVIRKQFHYVCDAGFLDRDKRLFIDGREVAIVYFGDGCVLRKYTEQMWEGRLMVERSLAVKCPDIGTQLAGDEIVQQALARPGVLEKFFPDDPEAVAQIRATFVGIYSLDEGDEGDANIEMALANLDRYFLKPKRKEGGENIYGEKMRCKLLTRCDREEPARQAYILMDMVRPQPHYNYLLGSGSPLKLSKCVNELGVYGAYVRRGADMLHNKCAGHLLRTMSVDDSVTGVNKTLDSPLLI